ncbi:MAG: hypothetical protein GEU99_23230 [Luteitalea sp.]|nr:hypothetical protein [Luteitalea sp.]
MTTGRVLAGRIASTLMILVILTSRAASQTTFATLTGAITDSSGSVLPGATIEAVHTATNYRYTGVSNEAGVYTIAQLREGEYVVRARLSGFKEVVVEHVQVAARDIRRLDISLDIGSVEETVEVVGGAGLIETETARITDTKDADLLKKLPLNTRSAIGFLAQTAGVYSHTGTTGTFTIRYGGSRTNQENAAIDGITITAHDSSVLGPMASYLESVEELRVDIGNNTAEFGSVGQMTVISKSGGN